MTYEIVPARLEHIRTLTRTMRAEDRAEVAGWGLTVRHTLHNLYRDSPVKRAALVDGELAAVWGVQGAVIGSEGAPWLFTTPAVERARMAFLQVTRHEIAEMLGTYRRLQTYTLASYAKSIRFFELLGFMFGPAEPVGVSGTPYRLMTLERKPDRLPFIVYGLPRSGTYWLSRFLSYGDWECWHEQAQRMRGVADVRSWLAQDCTGTAETAAAPWWRLVQHMRPDIRVLVVRRPVAEVVDALMRLDMRGTIEFSRADLTRRMERLDRKLDQIEARVPGALSVQFSDLWEEATAAQVFEHCLPYAHDRDWWERTAARNLQADMPALMRYQAAHRPQIEAAITLCREEAARGIRRGRLRRQMIRREDVTIQEETLETFYRDGAALFAEHCVAVGEPSDQWRRKNLPMIIQWQKAGVLQIVTARSNGRMLGYLVSLVAQSAERIGPLTATQTIFFASKDAHGLNLGMRLQRASIEVARQRGAGEVIMRAGVRGSGPDMEPLYRRLGGEEYGRLFRVDLRAA